MRSKAGSQYDEEPTSCPSCGVEISYSGLTVHVYLNFEVVGSVMVAGWSNEGTKVIVRGEQSTHNQHDGVVWNKAVCERVSATLKERGTWEMLMAAVPCILFVLCHFVSLMSLTVLSQKHSAIKMASNGI